MKSTLCIFLNICLLLLISSCGQFGKKNNLADNKLSYKNPLGVAIGDPYILKDSDSKYYMYGSGGGGRNTDTAYPTFSSTDLVNWVNEGFSLKRDTNTSWSVSAFWAPAVYKYKNKYYMYYSAQWRNNPNNELENFRISVAVSDKPTGPFIDIQNRPIFDPGYPIIDADVLFDSDGRVYLYYSRCCYKHPVESEISKWSRSKGWFEEIEESWVYGVEINNSFTETIGEPVLLLQPPLKMNDSISFWENRSVMTQEVNRRWTEGSYALKHNNTYYLMYSANNVGGINYSIGYATSKSPLGPYVKADNNPVVQKNLDKGGIVSGTGHNSITFSPDGKEMFCVYHGRTPETGNRRVLFIDRMEIKKDGQLVVHGPYTDSQPYPSSISVIK
jgi:beta-xylosidase